MDGNSLAAHSTVRLREYHNISDIVPHFERVGDQRQLWALQRLAPDHEETTHNIASINTLKYLVDELDPNTSVSDRTIDQLAIGSDDTEPTTSDTSLGSRIGAFSFNSTNDAGTTYETTTVLSKSQANGNTIAEVALETSGGDIFNRALVGPRDKTSDIAITLDVDLGFEAVE